MPSLDLAPRAPARTAPPDPLAVVQRVAKAVDPNDPVPVYRQIAAAVRWEIGMGRCHVGEVLPAIRRMAAGLGVHYHTVRRAYETLVAEGVVASRRGGGTVIVRPPAREARGARRVFVVECNLTEAGELAREVGGAFRVTALPWLLHGYGEPPPGVVLGTRFHAVEMRRQWPRRRGDIHTVDREPDPQVAHVIVTVARALPVRRLVLVERDLGTGRSMARELRARLALGGTPLEVVAPDHPDAVPERIRDALVLYAPRVWDGLSWAARSHPRAVALRFRACGASLDRIARQFAWHRHTPSTEPSWHAL